MELPGGCPRTRSGSSYVRGFWFLANAPPMTRSTVPTSTKSWAVPSRSNRYRTAPIHRDKMPSRTIPQANNTGTRTATLYLAAATAIVLSVYYLPNYFFLEKATADHAATLLSLLGTDASVTVDGQAVLLSGVRIVKDCTGIQAMAVFLGLLLPIPGAPWRRKGLTILLVVALVYVANLARIALEFWLLRNGILPWSLAHYPLSLLLGVSGVAFLVLVTDRLMPEFGGFLARLFQRGVERQ
ncbi:MAG: archaeosortase/exosortase family protein [Candidatus Verstraetearchaeota archaeon]|nr:archaeosortase/exosortase family protein [Candidatus Verstraetearchaeota archaeon]